MPRTQASKRALDTTRTRRETRARGGATERARLTRGLRALAHLAMVARRAFELDVWHQDQCYNAMLVALDRWRESALEPWREGQTDLRSLLYL